MRFAHRRETCLAADRPARPNLTKPDVATSDKGEFASDRGEFWGAFSETPPTQEPRISKGFDGEQGELGDFSDPLYARRDIYSRNPENIRSPLGASAKPPQTPPSPPKTGFNPAEISHSRGGGVLAQSPPVAWVRHVDALRPSSPLAGFPADRWRAFCADARWLVDQHGADLAGAGFSICDLFEIVPGRRDAGGLVEMLRGAREIVIDDLAASFRRGAVSIHFQAAGGDPVKTGWIGRAPWQP